MSTRNDNNLVMEDVEIPGGGWRNFAGHETMYNREGDRNFNVFLPEDTAQAMLADGWNIKWTKERETDDGYEQRAFLQVSVGYKGRPPHIRMLTSRGGQMLSHNEVEILDWVDIETADMIIRPYKWDVNGKTGIKAYLQSLVVRIEEDPLMLKYADVPELSRSEPLRALPSGKDVTEYDDDEIVEGEIVDE